MVRLPYSGHVTLYNRNRIFMVPRAEHQRGHYWLHRLYWAIYDVIKEKTYAVKESRPLHHMRNGSDRDSNPRPQTVTGADLSTAPPVSPNDSWWHEWQ
jgi:hypothetical protein